MIIQKEIEITIQPRTKTFYQNLGYKDIKIDDKLVIPIEHLPSKTHFKILCSCDKCGTQINVFYHKILKNNGDYICKTCSYMSKNKSIKNNELSYKIELSPFLWNKLKLDNERYLNVFIELNDCIKSDERTFEWKKYYTYISGKNMLLHALLIMDGTDYLFGIYESSNAISKVLTLEKEKAYRFLNGDVAPVTNLKGRPRE